MNVLGLDDVEKALNRGVETLLNASCASERRAEAARMQRLVSSVDSGRVRVVIVVFYLGFSAEIRGGQQSVNIFAS